MSATPLERHITLPWPHCWTQAQWDIAAWLARHGDRARVELTWNETALASQVTPEAMRAATAAGWEALRVRLGDGCRWHVAAGEPADPHRLRLWCAPADAGDTSAVTP